MSGKMVHYLIEFRFQGKAKSEIKRLIWEVDKRCRIGNTKRKRPVPHITLVAPFQTRNERKLINDFYDVCSESPLMKFSVKGFNTFENNRVMYFDIDPSEKLDNFRWELSKKLQPYCTLQPIDYERKYYFHSTVAMKLTPQKFTHVKSYIQRKEKPNFKHIVVRATLLKGGRILREYDFMQRKMFDRRLAKSKRAYTNTMNLLKRYFEGSYNPDDKMKMSFWSKIKSFFSG
tara:strand:- start:123 stop:815 length:693 start_codon:yes stop_codon:yes gene_type:complete